MPLRAWPRTQDAAAAAGADLALHTTHHKMGKSGAGGP